MNFKIKFTSLFSLLFIVGVLYGCTSNDQTTTENTIHEEVDKVQEEVAFEDQSEEEKNVVDEEEEKTPSSNIESKPKASEQKVSETVIAPSPVAINETNQQEVDKKQQGETFAHKQAEKQTSKQETTPVYKGKNERVKENSYEKKASKQVQSPTKEQISIVQKPKEPAKIAEKPKKDSVMIVQKPKKEYVYFGPKPKEPVKQVEKPNNEAITIVQKTIKDLLKMEQKSKKEPVKIERNQIEQKRNNEPVIIEQKPKQEPIEQKPKQQPIQKEQPKKEPVKIVPPKQEPKNNEQKPRNEQANNEQPPKASTSNQLNEFERQVVELTNEERAKHGLSKLAIDTNLSNVARIKSQDMFNHRYFSHTSPTYGSPFDMMKQYGINYRTAGENIAKGQRSPQEVVNAWMNSPGHRANILSADFTHIGVGYVEQGNHWTQMFISK